MKDKLYVCGIFITLAFLTLGGCNTAPPPPEQPAPEPPQVEVREVTKTIIVPGPPDTLLPLTNSILRSLNDSGTDPHNNIGSYQLRLFGRISLEREYTEKESTVIDGTAKLENVYTRENITINDQTEGQAIKIDGTGALFICFEEEDMFQLNFSAAPGDSESYFYLQYDEDAATDDVKGSILYGGVKYKLRYSGSRKPYLLIKLSQKDTDRLNSRTVSGRKVN
jgi:hypothetical protein